MLALIQGKTLNHILNKKLLNFSKNQFSVLLIKMVIDDKCKLAWTQQTI